MSKLMEDVLTAFNQARFEVADGFDKMRTDNMRFYRTHAQNWVTGVLKEYGDDDVRTYGAAFLSSLGDTMLDFVSGVASATFFDPLRLGAGVSKGTAGGYFEDALRVVGVVGGALKVLKFAGTIRRLNSVGGGLMSCLPTSAGKSLIWARLVSMVSVEEMAQSTIFRGAFVRLPNPFYPGAVFGEVIPVIKSMGAVVETNAVTSIEQIINLVNQNKGPVLFGVRWARPVAGTAQAIDGGGHAMMAYRPFFGSGIRLADQFGNLHTIEQVGKDIRIIAGPGTSTTGLSGQISLKAGDTIGSVLRVMPEAHVIRDAVWLDVAAHLPFAQRLGIPVFEMIDEQFWPKMGFAASMLPTAPAKLRGVGESVSAEIKKNPGGVSEKKAAANGPRAAGPPLSSHAQAMLKLLAPAGSATDWKSLRMKANTAGLSGERQYSAIRELEGWGVVQVNRPVGAVDELSILSVTRL